MLTNPSSQVNQPTDFADKTKKIMQSNTNLTAERSTFVTHLECGLKGDRYEADQIHGLSKAGKPLLVKYDLAALGEKVSKDELASRPPDMWRYRIEGKRRWGWNWLTNSVGKSPT